MMKRASTTASLVILLSSAALGQDGGRFSAVPNVSANDKLPEFDAVDIHVSKDASQPMAQFLPGGRVQFQAMPMKFMVLAAWGYENDEGRLSGGPSWMNTEKFDLLAKAPPDSSIATQRLMLRAFLIKRFGLEAHVEDKVMPVYVLSKGRGDLPIKPSATAGSPECTRSNQDSMTMETCHNMTMDDLANGFHSFAPFYIDKPVVNLTEIKGAYDFEFRWTPRAQLPTAGGMTIFEAADRQLGLKLESTEHAMPIIVVDKVTRMETVN